jgi:6-phosphofructokinase 2
MEVITLTINPALDKNSFIDTLIPEKKLRCSTPICEPGGGGINVARVLKRMHIEAKASYTEGGENGKKITSLLLNEKITTQPIPIEGSTRENINIVDKTGHCQYRFCFPGEILKEKTYQDLLRFIETISMGSILVISGSMPENYPKYFFEILSKSCLNRKIQLIIDTSGEALVQAIKHPTFLIKPNLGELATLVNKKSIAVENAYEYATEIVQNGKVKNVLVTCGAQGAWWVNKKGQWFIPAPNIFIKSTVGAGDSSLAGAIYGILNQCDEYHSLAWSISAGSATTMQSGTSLCLWDDVRSLYKSISKG